MQQREGVLLERKVVFSCRGSDVRSLENCHAHGCGAQGYIRAYAQCGVEVRPNARESPATAKQHDAFKQGTKTQTKFRAALASGNESDGNKKRS